MFFSVLVSSAVYLVIYFMCLVCFRSGQLLPQSARAEGATLHLLSITSELNGLYQCKASNPFGSSHGQLYVHVTSGEVRFHLVVFFCWRYVRQAQVCSRITACFLLVSLSYKPFGDISDMWWKASSGQPQNRTTAEYMCMLIWLKE